MDNNDRLCEKLTAENVSYREPNILSLYGYIR